MNLLTEATNIYPETNVLDVIQAIFALIILIILLVTVVKYHKAQLKIYTTTRGFKVLQEKERTTRIFHISKAIRRLNSKDNANAIYELVKIAGGINNE